MDHQPVTMFTDTDIKLKKIFFKSIYPKHLKLAYF